MSVLYISEFPLPNPAYVGLTPGMGYTQTVTYTTTAQSAVFQPTTGLIRIHSKTAFSYLISIDPTATTSHPRVPADGQMYIMVPPGAGLKIAAVDNA